MSVQTCSGAPGLYRHASGGIERFRDRGATVRSVDASPVRWATRTKAVIPAAPI